MNITMRVNTTQNVTYLNVRMADLNITGIGTKIGAENISLWVSSDLYGNYGYIGVFTNGYLGSNVTINSANWKTNMSTNPFVDSGGITNRNASIYCKFRLTIPASATPSSVYYNTTAWKVYIGRV
jgi:hypothetical protein